MYSLSVISMRKSFSNKLYILYILVPVRAQAIYQMKKLAWKALYGVTRAIVKQWQVAVLVSNRVPRKISKF